MPKFRVRLAQLERWVADVVVEAPSREELEDRLNEVWDEEGGSADWRVDDTWGVDEGTHEVLGEAPQDAQADFTLGSEDEEEDDDGE